MNVDWSERELYMWRRHGIAAQDANEAVEDEWALWVDPDPRSISGRGIRVIGYSTRCAQPLTVILISTGHDDTYWGVNGWPANATDRRAYWSRRT